MSQMDFRTAVCQALDEELEHDDSVIFFGEDVAMAGGVFATTGGLVDKHGTDRVFDTPISELALAGAAYGSAIAGLRPVIEIMFGDFLPLAMGWSTRRRSTGTSPTSRPASHSSCARPSAAAVASAPSTPRSRSAGSRASPG